MRARTFNEPSRPTRCAHRRFITCEAISCMPLPRFRGVDDALALRRIVVGSCCQASGRRSKRQPWNRRRGMLRRGLQVFRVVDAIVHGMRSYEVGGQVSHSSATRSDRVGSVSMARTVRQQHHQVDVCISSKRTVCMTIARLGSRTSRHRARCELRDVARQVERAYSPATCCVGYSYWAPGIADKAAAPMRARHRARA